MNLINKIKLIQCTMDFMLKGNIKNKLCINETAFDNKKH